MRDDPKSMSAELRHDIYEAVQAELLSSGVDRFGIDGVARRAGVDPGVILAHWHDRRVLLMEVMLARTIPSKWSPDTGSLYTDIENVSKLAQENSQNATARALFRRVLPGGGDVDFAEIGADLWKARFQFGAHILQRAADRGQLRDGIHPEEAIRMFATAFHHD
ncbi:MAG: hypothetical protein FGM52_09085, partial [Mycobacterium sp.]|nr:hypothetical protein [Mycobacterium sp.]